MRSRNLIVVACLALALASGCQKKFTTPSKSSPELIALLGASNVKTTGDTLTYELDAPYPARAQIAAIADHLRGRGFRPLQQSDFVRGWDDFTVQADHVYQWMGAWRNGGGDLVTYTLEYRYPAGDSPELSHLFVTAVKKRSGSKGLLQARDADPGAQPNVNHR